ncbi:hypothetical protein PUNSTDRAFT_108176 [Punctularia strigosozonata HHB-11173 SS5]|uniref:Core domain-containing protein n=1 Tax=Punctularia strigosozonata (strain HHB-11173) TaxID=741275 RepID=R7S1Z2_PUNST|nr:uncharacterized protein PUNSTDRAFT_108176 [Punctularia strigosozonata HHB-11173 SS5]EIN04430.1 hypothetical protein PUNSTDRAFT_108176 [Punctularia strigosozonata HHB-11173 SS5]
MARTTLHGHARHSSIASTSATRQDNSSNSATLTVHTGRGATSPTGSVASYIAPRHGRSASQIYWSREFSTTPSARAALATHPPAQQCRVTSAPTADALEDLEVDVEPIPETEAKIGLTERAAEQLRKISQREKVDDVALRIAVEAGGCHGYQYKMDLAYLSEGKQPEDYVFEHPQVRSARVVVDAVSLALLKGSTIDYATELIGSSFRVVDNPQAKGSGCGCGVSWEAKF